MEKINTKEAPKAIWPYSQAIKSWNLLYSSGQIWLQPKTMKLVNWGIENQTKQVCENLWAVLKKAWFEFYNVIKITIYLDNLDDFNKVNKIYWNYFSHKPARSTLEILTFHKKYI